ncbi:hypothetical protein PR202_gb11787 [Eleusine coracana subsp. coracana]|uniref:Uncharacterized protein n=1 Tax=Eleusine coracana subsp. coracana TaxID=191504 RepID=A0AAV5EL28_ELECO|nr:hypothetical protein PR202_gb11787 [Eleusine coracana subsp. coracana]
MRQQDLPPMQPLLPFNFDVFPLPALQPGRPRAILAADRSSPNKASREVEPQNLLLPHAAITIELKAVHRSSGHAFALLLSPGTPSMPTSSSSSSFTAPPRQGVQGPPRRLPFPTILGLVVILCPGCHEA